MMKKTQRYYERTFHKITKFSNQTMFDGVDFERGRQMVFISPLNFFYLIVFSHFGQYILRNAQRNGLSINYLPKNTFKIDFRKIISRLFPSLYSP